MDDTGRNGGIHLTDIWTRMDSLCGKLWDEDRRAAVSLQALIEEFRGEVDRAEKTVKSLQGAIKQQRQTIERELHSRFADHATDLENQIEDAHEHVKTLEASLQRERSRIQELTAALDAKELEIHKFQDEYLKTESDRDASRAEKMQSFVDDLHAKEQHLANAWTQRRQELEVEYERRGDDLQKEHLAQLHEIKQRALELEREYLHKENTLGAHHDGIRRGLEEKEALQREKEDELRQREVDLEKYKHELEDAWEKKRRELDAVKAKLQEELRAVISEYQAQKRP